MNGAATPVASALARGTRGTAAAPRDLLGFAALGATAAGLVALFVISPLTLQSWGIPYIDSGGGAFAKLHPATLVLAAALLLRCLGTPAPTRTMLRVVGRDSGVVLLLFAVGVAGLFAVAVDKTPVTPLVDSFVLPVLVYVLLRDLDPAVARWLAAIVAVLLALNAAIAMAEFVRGTRLIHLTIPDRITADPTRSDAQFSWEAELAIDWRATALLGHPLVNGLVTAEFILCLIATRAAWLPVPVTLALLALESAAMFAFGARGALVLAAGFGMLLAGSRYARAVTAGLRLRRRDIAIAVFALCCLCVLGVVLVATGFLDRTVERFAHDDGSATTRLRMFALLDMPLTDLFFKPDKDLVATLQRMQGLEFGIESSWLGLLLIYGAAVTAMLLCGLAAFSRTLVKRCGHGAGYVLLLFFILVSVSASLSGKTTSLAMTVALVMLFLRKGASDGLVRRTGVV